MIALLLIGALTHAATWDVSIYDGPKQGTWIIEVCKDSACSKDLVPEAVSKRDQDLLVQEMMRRIKSRK